MSFIDHYLSRMVPGFPCILAPRFKTTIQVNASGRERRNQEWNHPLHRYTLPEAAGRKWDVIDALANHWRIMRGPLHSWPFSDRFDFASIELLKPNESDATVIARLSATDQVIGVADGYTDRFQLKKTYSQFAETYERPIHLPRVSTVLVAIDGVLVDDADYTVTRPGGEIVFDVPPPDVGPGILTAGFLFDVEVRFESDDQFEGILRGTRVAGFADTTLVEVRPC